MIYTRYDKKTQDAARESRSERSAFAQVRAAEQLYSARLRTIATNIGRFVNTFFSHDVTPEALQAVRVVLEQYAETIAPWADNQAQRMLADVSRRDLRAWAYHARKISKLLSYEVMHAPTGLVLRDSLQRQVTLITSLPLEAAERVHNLAAYGYVAGARAGEIRYIPKEGLAKEILETGHVTASRANTIARTEVSRVSTELTKARATYVGSSHYIWRTVGDLDVRDLHRALEGTIHRWDSPPVTGSSGERSLPGGIYNCRCWAEPIIPETLI